MDPEGRTNTVLKTACVLSVLNFGDILLNTCLVFFFFLWNVFVLLHLEDDMHSVELTQFKEQFKSHLSELVRPVSSTYLPACITSTVAAFIDK